VSPVTIVAHDVALDGADAIVAHMRAPGSRLAGTISELARDGDGFLSCSIAVATAASVASVTSVASAPVAERLLAHALRFSGGAGGWPFFVPPPVASPSSLAQASVLVATSRWLGLCPSAMRSTMLAGCAGGLGAGGLGLFLTGLPVRRAHAYVAHLVGPAGGETAGGETSSAAGGSGEAAGGSGLGASWSEQEARLALWGAGFAHAEVAALGHESHEGHAGGGLVVALKDPLPVVRPHRLQNHLLPPAAAAAAAAAAADAADVAALSPSPSPPPDKRPQKKAKKGSAKGVSTRPAPLPVGRPASAALQFFDPCPPYLTPGGPSLPGLTVAAAARLLEKRVEGFAHHVKQFQVKE
jgi:hypothetical protein